MENYESYYQRFKYPIKTWIFSVFLGSIIYSLYTINIPKPHNLEVHFINGFILYVLSMGLEYILFFLIYCLCYFILTRYNIRSIWRKVVFIFIILITGIYQSISNERAFKFDIHGNYFYPYFESTMTVFWFIYGSSVIFFLLILKDKYKKEGINGNTEGQA